MKHNVIYVTQTSKNRAVLKFENMRYNVYIGENGTSNCKKEGDKKTPLGEYSLGLCFGIHEKDSLNLHKSLEYKKLTDIIFQYGEEKYARNIAKNIVKYRLNKKIETTLELAEIIKHSMPYKETLRSHPARKTFQAIRIEVNHEIEILDEAIRKALSVLNIGGRLVVITFHSFRQLYCLIYYQ